MKSNEFILIDEKGNKKSCIAVAMLYDNPTSRAFVVYNDEANSNILKVGEIVSNDDEVIVEELTDKDEIMKVWEEFINLCKKQAI